MHNYKSRYETKIMKVEGLHIENDCEQHSLKLTLWDSPQNLYLKQLENIKLQDKFCFFFFQSDLSKFSLTKLQKLLSKKKKNIQNFQFHNLQSFAAKFGDSKQWVEPDYCNFSFLSFLFIGCISRCLRKLFGCIFKCLGHFQRSLMMHWLPVTWGYLNIRYHIYCTVYPKAGYPPTLSKMCTTLSKISVHC